MAENLEELRADLDELRDLHATAKRARIQTLLFGAIAETEAKIKSLPAEPTAAAPAAEATGNSAAAAEEPPVPAASTQIKQPPVAAPRPASLPSRPGLQFVPIAKFGVDLGGYNEPMVKVYVDLPGVGAVKSEVECNFTAGSFDLKVNGLGGKNYRLLKTNLEHDILPESSSVVVKKDRLIIKLQKVKGEYSYESWQGLVSKKDPAAKSKSKADPTAGIMDMMKDMYDTGDENMKKIIGEAMMKSRSGQSGGPDF